MKETKFKNTEIGRIPEEWETLYIHQITEISTGATPSTNINEYWENGTIRWMSSGELNNKIIYDVNGRITQKGYDNTGTHMLPKNCVLIGLAGQGKTRGTAAYNKVELCTNQSIAAILPNSKYESKYLYFYIDSLYDKLRLLSAGDGGRGGLNKQILQNLEIAMPPLNEQHRIASALTSIDNLISSLGKLTEKKNNIKQGTMQQLLTGKTRLKGFTKPWVYRKISEIATTSSGGTPSRSIPSYYYGDIKWFTTTELKDNYLYDSVEHITREALSNSSAKMFSANTILMAMYGATIGKLGILKEPSATNQACCAIKCNDIDEIFLFYILLYNRKSIIEKGCGAGQPNISQTIVNELSFLVPPCKKEQQAIANILSKMDNDITALEAKRAKYEAIKQGMMQQLLTGKIRLIS